MEKKVYGIEEFLSRPKTLEEQIRRDIDHIASLRSIVEKTTTQMSFTAGRNPSKNEKAFEKVMIQIAEEEVALEAKQKRLVEMKLEVENLIKRIQNKRQQAALRLYYLQGLKWEEVAARLNIYGHYIYNLRDAAIRSAGKLLQEMDDYL